MAATKTCLGCGEKFSPGPRDYGKRWERRLFCSRGCRNKIHTNERPLAERFWEKVKRRGPDECWPWTAAVDSFGYGRIWTGSRVDGSNRVAWEITNGPIPEGEGHHGVCVLHRCDNPKCCNPTHLFLGTNADNLQDMAHKGRHGMAKLTENDVRTIREIAKTRRYTQARIAQMFGVSDAMVNFIVNRKNWKHI